MNNIFNLDIKLNRPLPQTFKESVIQFISRMIIVYILIYSSICNFTDSLKLFDNSDIIHYKTHLYIITFFICTAIGVILFSNKLRSVFTFIIMAVMGAIIFFMWDYIKDIFIIFGNRVDWLGRKGNAARSAYTLTQSQIDNTKSVYVAAVLTIILLSFIIIWAIMHRYSLIVCMSTIMIPIVVPMCYNIEPNYLAVTATVCGLMMLFACSKESELLKPKESHIHFVIKKKGKVLELSHRVYLRRYLVQQSIFMAVIMFAVLIIIHAVYPTSNYYNKDLANKLSNNIYNFAEYSIDKMADFLKYMGDYDTDFILNDGNFNNAGNASYDGRTMLLVNISKNDIEMPIYLRGFVGKDYSSNEWDYDSSVQKYAFTTNGVEFRPALMPYLYSLLTSDGNYEENQYTITVENQYSLSNRIFTTYNTGGIYCQNTSLIESTYDGEFYSGDNTNNKNKLNYTLTCYNNNIDTSKIAYFNIDSSDIYKNNIFEILKYETLVYSDDDVYLSQEYNYVTNESIYRNYVFNNYLDVNYEIKNYFIGECEELFKNDIILSKYKNALYSYYRYGDYKQICDLIRAYIHSKATYTLTPGDTPEGKDSVLYFLEENRKGYCMHFASSATLLLRSFGIPARYVEGYLVTSSDVNTADSSGTFAVKDSSAHAWVEIYVSGYGWVPVEFTPGYNSSNFTNPNDTSSTDSESDIPSSQPENSSEGVSSEENSSNDESDINSSINISELPSIDMNNSDISSNQDTKNTSNVWKPVLIIFIIIFIIAMIIVVIITGRAYTLKQREKMFNMKNYNMSAINMFKYALDVLKFYGYPIEKNESYDNYSVRIVNMSGLNSCENFVRISQIAVMCKFSQYRIKGKLFDEMNNFSKTLAEEVYSKQNIIGRLRMKYINRLI